MPEIHRELSARGVGVSERTVTNLLDRYEELVALRLTDRDRLKEKLWAAGTSGPSPRRLAARRRPRGFVGGARCLSGEVLLAQKPS